MEIVDLLITKAIAEKLARKHNIEGYEVYEAFWNEEDAVRIFRSPRGSGTYIAFGRTEAGRYLAIPFVPKGKIAHILTTRDMTERERKLYKER
ncbi:MAG: BrnT family toxin [Actinobacteria bacterium]|nr:BrnT family toxin [Actinomycetota bacterium]